VKLEERVETLEKQVRSLMPHDGPPEEADLVELLLILCGRNQKALALARENGGNACKTLVAALDGLTLPPGSEELRQTLVCCVGGLSEGGQAYREALPAVKEALLALRELRRSWPHRFPDLWMSAGAGYLHPGGDVSRARGGQIALLAAAALQYEQGVLDTWREWVRGEGARWHSFCVGERMALRPTFYVGKDARQLWDETSQDRRLPQGEEEELVRRGMVTPEELVAVDALPEIAPGRGSLKEREAAALERELETF